MNTSIVLLLTICLAIVKCQQQQQKQQQQQPQQQQQQQQKQQGYTTRYDNINIDNILSNNRLRNNYIKCLTGDGKCNSEGATLRDIVPDALKSGCKKCNPLQRRTVTRIVKYMMKSQPKEWERLTKKFDPNGEFTEQYKELLKDGP